MQHNRRKKKRINYGVRAVELMRGSKGFGFTISGQQPCILSCIVPGSPAELVGLRSGDYLVAVNGHNVSKAPHDDVVRLIGHSVGMLRLQIAENYYSDSSDEEGPAATRSKPKYSHKQRNPVSSNNLQGTTTASALLQQSRVAKVVRDLHSGAMFSGNMPQEQESESVMVAAPLHSNHHHRCCWSMPNAPPPPNKRDAEKIVHRTVVGYLGTIDIPNLLHPSTMMQVLRKCIKRLKAEKRNPTTVLLTIHVANIKLTNSENKIIAEYPSHRIVFCNSFSEQDKQYFGIVTKSAKDTADDIVSNSCHVFTIYYKLIDHSVHLSTSNIFGFTCTRTSELSVCQEFPDSCHGLIGAIQTLYISSDAKNSVTDNNTSNNNNNGNNQLGDEVMSNSTRKDRNRNVVSPQPSNISTSTAHSSNSDSGIGFKDDCSIRVEHNMNLDMVSCRLTVRTVKEGETAVSLENGDEQGGDTTTCLAAAATGPSGVASMTTKQLAASAGSVGSLTFSRMLRNAAVKVDDMDSCATDISTNKFSPKVFNGSKTFAHSMEDIKPVERTNLEPDTDVNFVKPADVRPWGSLQEIRNIGGYQSNHCLYGSIESCDKNDGGVHTWVVGFEKLLKDPKGLQAFAEFLKKEFSHENIYFWAACERYKDTEDMTSRRRLAWQIYERHLSTNAIEPVNVDSHAAGQITQELLNSAPEHLFLQAQKQVFELMKFDSYPRFLRSDIYRQCLETGSGIINDDDHDLDLATTTNVKLKKSHSDAEDRCRKSILPWHRKNRSKSKDRGESEYNKTPNRGEPIYKSFTTIKRDPENNNNDDNISISSSRSSLASWDLALRQSFSKHSLSSHDGRNDKKDVQAKCTGLCRVILPDGSTTVVPTSQSESIKDVVTRLLDKRALRYSNYDVLVLATDEMINAKYSSSVLAGQEVEVVPNKILKVDLPSRRIITVVAHKGRTLRDVLRPLLNKYGFKLELITIWGEGHPVSLDVPAINAPRRLVLTSNTEDFHRDNLHYQEDIEQGQSTLDEITNKVFEELLVGKGTNNTRNYSTEGSCKSDDQRSEGSSILSSKFLFTRDTTILGKKKSKSKSSNVSEKSNSTTGEESSCQSSRPRPQPPPPPPPSHAPLIAKWRNGVKLQLPGRFDGDELYEGLKRAQRSRLEDQRGTEINYELPDFLKQNKENGKQQADNKKHRRGRGLLSSTNDCVSKFYDSGDDKNKKSTNPTIHKQHFEKSNCNSREEGEYISIFVDSTERLDPINSLDGTLEDVDQTIIETNGQQTSCENQFLTSSPEKLLKPPPLPPKPKGLLTNVAAAVKTSQILPTKPLPRHTQISPIVPLLESRDNKNIF